MMTETEDQIVSDHSKIVRGLSASSMRLMEMVQRRKEEARRREAEGQREAAQALRDREVAQRDAARTIAAQGLDPRWREAASDRDLATAFVYAEAYRESDALSRVAHDQLTQHIADRHDDVAAFVDGHVSAADLERVPVPEGEPSATQQRWLDAARGADAAERHQEALDAVAQGQDTEYEQLRGEQIQQLADNTLGSVMGENPETVIVAYGASEDGPERITVLDPEVTQRWSEERVGDIVDLEADLLVRVPETGDYTHRQQIDAHLAVVGDDVAKQWSRISEEYGRDRADRWLQDNLTRSEMAETNKWMLWNEAQAAIAEGMSVDQAMRELGESERELEAYLESGDVADLGLDATDDPQALAEAEGQAATARERGDMEHAGLGQFHDESPNSESLADRDPQAAQVLETTKPGRTHDAAAQVESASTQKHIKQFKERAARRDRDRGGQTHDLQR